MSIFSAGIVWDPREPLPTDIGGHPHVAYYTHSLSVKQPLTNDNNNLPTSMPDTFKEFPDNVLKEPTRNLLSPSSVSINGRIVDDTAQVTVSQVFWNNAQIPIPKASYVFPLPTGCTVTSFSCRIGRDKTIRAKIKPKAEAQEAFQKAVAAQRTAALLEQNTPELFTASLGNIPPDTRLEAELTYVTLLKRQFSQEKNITEFSIPTAIACRYGNPPPDIQGNLSGDAPSSLTLQLEVMEAEKILQIKSDTHKIVLDQGFDKANASNWVDLLGKNQRSRIDVAMVNLDSNVGFLHEDFILTIETNTPSKVDYAHAWLESHPTLEKQKAMMITIPSSLMLENKEMPKKGEVMFLVDRSGSMQDKIEAVKSSLKFFLKGIPVGRKFNIWSFGSNFKQLWNKSQDYSSASLKKALDYVETLKSDMGGTELLPALTAMVSYRDTSCPCDMIILTDGQVWRLDETLKLVQDTRTKSHGDVRFFSLGIGSHVSHALVQGIASYGGGYSEVILKASTGGWEDRVVAMLKAALTTHVSSLGIKLNGKHNYDRFLASPAEIENLNPFQGNRIYLLSKPDSRLDDLKSVTIEIIKSGGTKETTTISVTALKRPDTVIHNLAVQSIVENAGQPGKKTLTSTEATDLACRFSLVSRWTSFFLEQETPKLKDEDNGIQVHDASDDLDDLLQPRGTVRIATSDTVCQIKRISAAGFYNTANFDAEFSSASTFDPTIEDSSERAIVQPQFQGFSYCEHPYQEMNGLESLRQSTYAPKRMMFAHAHEKTGRAPPIFNFRSLMPSIGTWPAKLRKRLSRGEDTDQIVRDRMLSGSSRPESTRIPPEMMPKVPEPKPGNTGPDISTVDIHKEFVTKLLSYQIYNGSFHVDTKSILGPSLTEAAQEIEKFAVKNAIVRAPVAGFLTYTVVAVLLLERDMLDCKDLWGLMVTKARQYISDLVKNDSKKSKFYNFAKQQLAGRRLPGKDAEASPANQATPSAESSSSQQPERSVIKVAPIE